MITTCPKKGLGFRGLGWVSGCTRVLELLRVLDFGLGSGPSRLLTHDVNGCRIHLASQHLNASQTCLSQAAKLHGTYSRRYSCC